MADRKEQTVDLDGIKFYTVLERPKNAAKTDAVVLLIHALMSNHRMWESTVAALNEAGFTTLRYDHVGHNNTPAPTGSKQDFHFDDFTRQMHDLVKAVTGQTKVYAVIGCSVGGVLALRYAMMFPQDVEAVISCDAPGMTTIEAAKPLWTQRIQQFEDDQKAGKDDLCRATVDRWFPGSDEQTIAVRAESLKHVKTCSLQGYKICADAVRNFDYTGQLLEIEARCMVLVGSEDTAVGPPELLISVAEKIKGSEYVMLDGAGHLPPLHRPEKFNEVMLRFLSKRDQTTRMAKV